VSETERMAQSARPFYSTINDQHPTYNGWPIYHVVAADGRCRYAGCDFPGNGEPELLAAGEGVQHPEEKP
jgi:hypothetical protein